jgi:hypothetical protein
VKKRSKKTVSDARPITANITATARAGAPMWRIISVQLKPIVSPLPIAAGAITR